MHSFSLLQTINVRRDRGRKIPHSVAGKGPSHTCKEINTTIKNKQRIMHSFSLIRTIT